ncbi:alpha/beta-Hydrolase [Glarea lozoyensis ATCC 20868]|uniref:Alpha/beta-Hydrolase n=1 Tax=Glarea lozoyensis (strain ATCC 20868 / MF5171) TaxID=1116229 RepID=S3DAW9_GLAL2|nr:alpha/beta-Hydrolase [Glarea lozoyensis ATCC 20868]EPE35617.1 alpha/beta-Hydrolase [Glarea lozoyensis ATCC 20868]
MFHSYFLFVLLISALRNTAANPVRDLKTCREYTLPVDVTSINYIWGLPQLHTNYDAATFNSKLGRWDANVTLNPISGGAQVSASYQISGTFCAPVRGGNGIVLVATHGFGFDRSYWNPEIQPEKYSFVDHAISKGYSIFYYDRLGIGKSSSISGYVAQVSVQVAVLKQIVTQVKAGKLCATTKKVVLVGHSFGSVVSNVLLTSSPQLVDGVVLTGIGYDVPDTAVAFESWQPRLARLQNPRKWGSLDGGYMTWVDIWSNAMTFFKAPFYDTKVVEYAEANKQPFGLLEVVTLQITDRHSPNYTGPALIMSGEFDLVFCNGYCPPILNNKVKETFPVSKGLEVYSQPGSGHAINLSLNATGSFEVVTGFLKRHGL